jgi:N-acetylmuramoyl-L-alanine amidase
MPYYTIEQGDCISSIAYEHGFDWEKIWKHPQNAKLKAERNNPNVLYPGDVVFIPDKEEKWVARATEKRHSFVRKGVPALVRLALVDRDGNPRANERYILDIEGKLFTGVTKADGKIEYRIPPNARQGKLTVGAEGKEVYTLRLGHTDPVSKVSGVQSRLQNLGYDCGAIDGQMGPATQSSLRAFQKKHGLQETGEPDEATLNKLKEVHGS